MSDELSKVQQKLFTDCLDDLKKPIADLCRKYPIAVVESALIEMGMRMILTSAGSLPALHMLSVCVQNATSIGHLIEKDLASMREEGQEPDALEDWMYNANITGKTIH